MPPRDPLPLSAALSELIAIRGFARVRSDNELETAWKQIAGPDIAAQTRTMAINRGFDDLRGKSSLAQRTRFVPGTGTFTKTQTSIPTLQDQVAEVQIEWNMN